MIYIKQSRNVSPTGAGTGQWTWASWLAKRIAITSAALALAGGIASAATYYVATDGSDSNPGTLAQPFATLEKARDTATAGDTVYLRDGTYLRTNTFTLGYTNSGVTYAAYPGETPVLVGGLPLTGWQTYSGSILCVNSSTQGVSAPFRMLLFNGQRQIKARYPNYNPADPYGYLTNGQNGCEWLYMATTPSQSSFTYGTSDLPNVANWANPTLAEVVHFDAHNYGTFIESIGSLNTGTRTITIPGSQNPDTLQIAAGDRYYIQNVFEELDTTNEFYVNPTTHYVYWYPPSTPGSTPAYAILTTNLVYINPGTSNVLFNGFTFDGACSTAVTMTNTVNCVVSGGVIRNIGDWFQLDGAGYGIWLHGGTNNGVVTNTIYSIASDGVQCDGGSISPITLCSNYAAYNTICQVGVINKQVAGVRLNGAGCRASHNLIFNCPRWGVAAQVYHGLYIKAPTLEYNHIYNCDLETDDTAGIYFYVDTTGWTYSGGVIRYNYIHNSGCYAATTGNSGTRRPTTSDYFWTYGIYIDNSGHDVDVYGNVIDQMPYGCIFINGGSTNQVHNNILLQTTNCEFLINSSSASGNTYQTNICVYQPAGMGDYIYIQTGGTGYPAANSFDYNDAYANATTIQCYIGGPYYWGSTWQGLGADTHSISVDPQFRLSAPGDYYVQNASVLALGFQQIPARQIGPTNLFSLPVPPTGLIVTNLTF